MLLHHGLIMILLSFILIAVLGAFIASFLALIPALHIYNVITLAFLFAGACSRGCSPINFRSCC